VPENGSSFKPDQKGGDTTPCTLAYKMIREHNKKGLDIVEICIRLWNGFVKGEENGEGCMVETKLLFNVLDYIRS
jgi:hypothetical protein